MNALVEQRWTKPGVYDVEAGHWKKQLSAKHLKVAARGNVEELKRLLSDNPGFLNARGNHGRTLLWEACRKGRLDAVKYLLTKGTDHHHTGCYNSESHVQLDCYCAARFYNRPDVADCIFDRGVEPDIFRACFLGDQERICRQLAANQLLVNDEDPHDEIYRMPPIAFALAGGQLKVADYLIDAGANVANYSSLLIFMVGLLDRQEFIDPLIDAGLELGATDSSTFVAAKSVSCLSALLTRGAPIDNPNKGGYPPLVYLCRPDKSKSLDKIELLLSHGADVNRAGPRGKTALHFAVLRQRIDVVSLLIRHGADPNLRDEDGNSALEVAAAARNDDIAAILQT